MMLKNKRRNAILLVLLYVSYYVCISFFVHTHIYNGVLYTHSHPFFYEKGEKPGYPIPLDEHHHTPASLLTLNKLYHALSHEAKNSQWVVSQLPCRYIEYKHLIVRNPILFVAKEYRLRAPPIA